LGQARKEVVRELPLVGFRRPEHRVHLAPSRCPPRRRREQNAGARRGDAAGRTPRTRESDQVFASGHARTMGPIPSRGIHKNAAIFLHIRGNATRVARQLI
jgi:hypothetical protein